MTGRLDRTVLTTGANSGIGLATVMHLAKARVPIGGLGPLRGEGNSLDGLGPSPDGETRTLVCDAGGAGIGSLGPNALTSRRHDIHTPHGAPAALGGLGPDQCIGTLASGAHLNCCLKQGDREPRPRRGT